MIAKASAFASRFFSIAVVCGAISRARLVVWIFFRMFSELFQAPFFVEGKPLFASHSASRSGEPTFAFSLVPRIRMVSQWWIVIVFVGAPFLRISITGLPAHMQHPSVGAESASIAPSSAAACGGISDLRTPLPPFEKSVSTISTRSACSIIAGMSFGANAATAVVETAASKMAIDFMCL